MFTKCNWKKLFHFLATKHCGRRAHSQKMLGSSPSVCPLRLCEVNGYDGRSNDVVYCHPALRTEEDAAVVYFGGDVQDFPENMESHRDNKNYIKWNLENTAVMLHTCFPESHVVVVRPARLTTPKLATFMELISSEINQNRMEFKTFSCFDNFVPCNNSGAPDHTPTHYALHHLERLLQGVSQRLRSMSAKELLHRPQKENDTEKPEKEEEEEMEGSEKDDENLKDDENSLWWREGLNLDKARLTLIGFSKGCVVLNQFIYEFHYLKTLTPDDDTMMRLVSRIRDMYWLDGGHAGGKNTWVTSRSLLETLTRLGIGIHIHVTPYQVNDDRRPWIRKEEKTFGDLLRRLGAPVTRELHFENQVANLFTHFEVLSAFHQDSK